MAYKPSQRPRPNIKIIFASLIEPTFLKQQTELHFFQAFPSRSLAALTPAQGKEPYSEGTRGLGAGEVEVEGEMAGVEGKDFGHPWGSN